MQMKLNLNNLNGSENVRNDDPAANLETNSEPIGDDSDDEITEPRDFGEYLHMMLLIPLMKNKQCFLEIVANRLNKIRLC
ncbi:unnamed protein product [Rhizophagus irregularis]|nr:unnamed protein product [Rhizophagus irregularis]